MEGRTILVTGASRGLGRALAEEAASTGANVVAVVRDEGAAQNLAPVLAVHEGKSRVVSLDLRDEPAVVALISSLEVLDVVINSAGIARHRPLLETPTEELREVLAVNVVAPFVVTREAIRLMLRTSGKGHIVNIASTAALEGIPGMAPYAASKHALLGFGRSVSAEFRARGIRVTTVNSGRIATDIMGSGNINDLAMKPGQLARAILGLTEFPPAFEVSEILVEPTSLPGVNHHGD